MIEAPASKEENIFFWVRSKATELMIILSSFPLIVNSLMYHCSRFVILLCYTPAPLGRPVDPDVTPLTTFPCVAGGLSHTKASPSVCTSCRVSAGNAENHSRVGIAPGWRRAAANLSRQNGRGSSTCFSSICSCRIWCRFSSAGDDTTPTWSWSVTGRPRSLSRTEPPTR